MSDRIKPEELRIGNILKNGYVVTIQYNEGVWGCIVTPSPYSSGSGWEFVKQDDLRPIPLSKDWLERFGFETHEKPTGQTLYTIPAITSQGRKTGFILRQCANGSYTPACYTDIHEEIWYVHQLQNLYFAFNKHRVTT